MMAMTIVRITCAMCVYCAIPLIYGAMNGTLTYPMLEGRHGRYPHDI